MACIQPAVMAAIRRTPTLLSYVALSVFYALLLADIAITIISLMKMQKQVRLTADINMLLNKISETVGEKLSEGTMKGMEQKERLEKELTEQKDRLGEQFTERKDRLGEQFTERKDRLGQELTERKDRLGQELTERKDKLEKELTERKDRLGEQLMEQKEKLAEQLERLEHRKSEFKKSRKEYVRKRLEKAFPGMHLPDMKEISERYEVLKDKMEEKFNTKH